MKTIIVRTISGIIFIAIVIGAIILSRFAFLGVFLLISLLGMYEYFKLTDANKNFTQKINGYVLGALIFLLISLFAFDVISASVLYLLLLVPVIILISELFSNRPQPLSNAAVTLLGLIYIPLPLALLSFFYSPFQTKGEFHVFLLLGFFIITWLIDTMAYLTGMAFGKHRLFERISPKKSWEGAIGGFIFGIIAAYVLSWIFKEIPFVHWAMIAVIISVFGTLGDLAESMFKRSVEIKDTGSIMPGHGGMLDRFDAVLFSAPAVFIYIQLFINNSSL